MGEVTVSAKDKKKDKTDRDKRSRTDRFQTRRRKTLRKRATRKTLKAERKLAKKKAKEEKELAEVLEQSRLEAERGAKELQALSSRPIVPTPLLVLGKQKLFVSDKHGSLHVPASRALNKHRVYRVRANRKSHDIPLEAKPHTRELVVI
jgi:hypothetical protein